MLIYLKHPALLLSVQIELALPKIQQYLYRNKLPGLLYPFGAYCVHQLYRFWLDMTALFVGEHAIIRGADWPVLEAEVELPEQAKTPATA